MDTYGSTPELAKSKQQILQAAYAELAELDRSTNPQPVAKTGVRTRLFVLLACACVLVVLCGIVILAQ